MPAEEEGEEEEEDGGTGVASPFGVDGAISFEELVVFMPLPLHRTQYLISIFT